MHRKKLIVTILSLFICGFVFTSVGLSLGTVSNFYMDKTGFHAISKDIVSFYEEKLDPVENIKITTDTPYDIHIIEGDTFSLCYQGNSLEYSLENGTLTLSESLNDADYTTKFVFNGGLSSIMTSRYMQTGYGRNTITITIPKDTSLGYINLDIKSGDIHLDNVTASTLHIESNYGDVAFTNTAVENITTTMAHGDIVIKHLNTPSFRLFSNYGDVTISNSNIVSADTIINNGDISVDHLTAISFVLFSNYGNVAISNSDIITNDTALDNGDATIEDVSSSTFILSSDYGDITASNLIAHDLTVDLDSGNFKMDGYIGNSADLYNHYGDITLLLGGSETLFSTDLTVNHGEINMNGKTSGKLSDSPKTITAHTSSGDISIQFNS